jgi:predicted transcriptional regulator
MQIEVKVMNYVTLLLSLTLSQKICQSRSYASRRKKLANLLQDILDLISQPAINITTIEELFPIPDNHTQSTLAQLIRENKRTIHESLLL